MQRLFIALMVLSLLLSACGTFEIYVDAPAEGEPAAPPLQATPKPRLSLNSSSEEIRGAMLKSATDWLSIWLDGKVTQYAPEGSDAPLQVFREQVWIDQSTSRFRILTGPTGGNAERFIACDGMTILEMDLKTGQSQSHPLPESAQVRQFVPTLKQGFAYPQPLWGQMGTPLSQLAFPSDFAQGDGIFKPVATEFIAGRETVVVEWTNAQNDLPSWRMWLDAKTAIILKMQTFGKGGEDTILSEAIVDQVIYEDIFADSLFRAPASLPQFGDVSGLGIEPVETGTMALSGKDALGELYFFTLPRKAGQLIQLVRLPGMCVVGLAECPQVESVAPPFPLNFSLTPLSWSPDGNFAAFAYPDDPNGTPYKLWLFDPAAQTWAELFEYPYIDPPTWSPDGKWIAFRVQDGLGGEDVYVVQRDGSGLKNLTSSGSLKREGRPYVMDGWITGNIIVRSAKPGNEGVIYLVRIADGRVRPMFETSLTKAVFMPSNDGAWLAYDDYDYDSQKHTLYVTEPDGANPVELASFTGGTLYPIVWSPDNKHLAFAYYAEFTQGSDPTADVYMIDRDGRGLKQVYRGVTVGDLMFSPDGKFLLISETTSPTGGHLFAANLETLEQRILQAPGLSLDTDWFMPSWRH
jgi:Tol biopolymer transport system component